MSLNLWTVEWVANKFLKYKDLKFWVDSLVFQSNKMSAIQFSFVKYEDLMVSLTKRQERWKTVIRYGDS